MPCAALQALSVVLVLFVARDAAGQADVALLARVAFHRQPRIDVAGLAGFDLNLLRVRHQLTVPRSLTDPMDVETSDVSRRVLRGAVDLGIEGELRLTARTALVVFGLVGLQSPYEEQRRAQLRAGVILKRRF